MAGPASDYHRGEMDIHEQASTFQLVMGITKWGSLVMAAFLLFLVLWFCTPRGLRLRLRQRRSSCWRSASSCCAASRKPLTRA